MCVYVDNSVDLVDFSRKMDEKRHLYLGEPILIFLQVK